jgi:hypothetical protein
VLVGGREDAKVGMVPGLSCQMDYKTKYGILLQTYIMLRLRVLLARSRKHNGGTWEPVLLL